VGQINGVKCDYMTAEDTRHPIDTFGKPQSNFKHTQLNVACTEKNLYSFQIYISTAYTPYKIFAKEKKEINDVYFY